MKITVTQENITYGCPEDGDACAVALAIIDACNPEHVWVGPEIIEINDWTYHTPAEIAEFIHEFDTDKNQCRPCEFDLDYNP